MNDERIESFLERIAVALERLAANTNCSLDCPPSRPSVPAESQSEAAFDPAMPGDVEESLSKIELFLNSRNISIKCVPSDDAADHVIDRLSTFLGERYDALSGLLAKIKRAMQSGMMISESLKTYSQQDISSLCQFCNSLHGVAFLEQYQYFRSPTYLIQAKTTTLPKAQRFFGGQWLERFILQKVKLVYAQICAEVSGSFEFEFLINPQIVLPNGDDFELDVMAAIGSSVYWIEAKSGDYQQHVAKYSKFAHTLGLDNAHSMLVLADVPENRCDALSSLFSMNVCNLGSFEENLLTVARNDTALQSAPAD